MSDLVSDDDSDDKDIGGSSSSQPPKDFSAPFGVAYHAIGQEFYPVYQERCDNAIASTNKYKRDNVDVTSPEAIFLLQPLYEQGLIPNMRRFDIEPYLNVSAFCMYLLSNVEASLIRVVLSINEFISKSHSLKKLNKSKSHSLETQIEETRAKLHDIQEHLKGDRADNDMIDMEKHLKKEPHLKLRASFLMKSQQAKVDWITLGDQNSKLFYAWVKKRKLQNHITSLTNANGIEKEGKEKVAEILVEYAKKQLGTSIETESINKDIVELGNKLSIEQQLILISHVTPEEFKSCIFEIPNNKSPGPDGYSSGFFKNQWSKVGELTTRAIMSFFQKDDTLKQINATNLIFIPKKEEPKSPVDLRPIACCNVLYKTISKIFCRRLKKILPSIVSLNQGAFIEGRELVHNVLLCQEFARGYNRKNISPRCLMKLDLQKAYDNVSWKAIEQLLLYLNFPSRFIKWISYCVTSTSYSIHLEGQNFGFFKGIRGLRQGDPISPLLFVLIMEYLTRSFQYLATKENFTYHPMCKSLKVINIVFVDDLIVACKADEKSIKTIMLVDHFKHTTCLSVNPLKSEIIFGGINKEMEENLLGLPHVEFLGV